jgi:hypothetical protein
MADEVLTIPKDHTLPIKVGDNLYIQVSDTCQWCYSDTTPCFPGGLLKPGQYNKTTGGFKYGPYPAKAKGTVYFDSPTNPPCNPKNEPDTGHTIVVSN